MTSPSFESLPAPEAAAPPSQDLFTNHPLTAWALIGVLLLVFVGTIFKVPTLGAGGEVVDFDAFYIAGQMIWEGRLAEAYDPAVMMARQSLHAEGQIFMPWSYPPPFNLVAAVLPFGSRGLSYGLFIGLTLACYLLVLRKLAGPWLTGVLLATLPGLAVEVRTGQNGLLTGALAGVFCLLLLREKRSAGAALGLMVLKPHLAVGLGVLTLLQRRWSVLALGFAVVGAACLLSTLLLGAEVWPAFFEGARLAKINMAAGIYPLYRMTSVYATLFSLGLSAQLALALHVCGTLLAFGSILVALRRNWPPARALGVTMLATLAFSPYNYDYDMTILTLGLALLAPDLMRHSLPWERFALLAAAWLCTGWGMLLRNVKGDSYDSVWLSLGGLGFVLTCALCWRILLRIPRDAAAEGVTG